MNCLSELPSRESKQKTLVNIAQTVQKLDQSKAYEDLNPFLKRIQEETFLKYVLLIGGSQIGGSLSPFIHTYSAYRKGISMLYTLQDISKENDKYLEDLLKRMEENPQILGANVTMPYKILVYKILKEGGNLDNSALIAGAVNTISKVNGNLKGYNSDMDGIYGPIKNKLGEKITEIDNAYILGAGGAASAGIAGLLKLGIKNIHIFNRTKENGEKLKMHFQSPEVQKALDEIGINDYSISNYEYDVSNPEKNQISQTIDSPGIFLNTLPFAFKDEFPKMPITEEELIKLKPSIKLFFDAVYDLNHEATPILEKINSWQIPTCDGRDMVVGQAGKGFELWAKEKFPSEEILSLLK